MILLEKIKRIFARKDGKLPLIHYHTFKSGEKLYTYRPEDYGKLSSRYYRAIAEQMNYINMYQFDKAKTISNFSMIQDKCKEIAGGSDDYIKLAMDIYSMVEFQKTIPMNKTSIQLKFYEVLFCMFFILDEEIECGYNEAMNDKKLKLLFKEDESTKDTFFLHVKEILNNLDIQLEIDMVRMTTLLSKYSHRAL